MQNDDGLFINMFAGGEYKTTALGGYKRLNIETKFPFEGKITISISDIADKSSEDDAPSDKKIYVRIPEYAQNYKIKINGCDII